MPLTVFEKKIETTNAQLKTIDGNNLKYILVHIMYLYRKGNDYILERKIIYLSSRDNQNE